MSNEETCTDIFDGREFRCSKCRTFWFAMTKDEAYEWTFAPPSYCPGCGAKVIREVVDDE